MRSTRILLAVLLGSLLCLVGPSAALGVSPQALYDEFARNGQLTCEHTVAELQAYLESSSTALYGDPEIKARLDQTVVGLLGRRTSPFTLPRLIAAVVTGVCLAGCAVLPWLFLRRRGRIRSPDQAAVSEATDLTYSASALDRVAERAIWAGPLVALLGLWLWLAFSSGGYLPRHWLVYGLGLGFFGLVTAALTTYSRPPRQLSLAVLGLYAGYCLWTAASSLWAESGNRVWLETARGFAFLLVFAVAAAVLTDPQARRLLRYLMLLAALVLIAVTVATIWIGGDLSLYFTDDRLSYPTGTPDSAAALYLLLFWPLLWLAASPEEKPPLRGAALGLATGLLALALFTQSPVGLCGLALSACFVFLLCPARSRLLLRLFVPGLLVLYEFPTFKKYWTQGAEAIGPTSAGRSLLTATVVAAFIGLVLALLERWIRVTRRIRMIFGAVVLAAVVAGLAYGAVQAAQEPGGPVKWATQLWQQVTGQVGAQSEGPAQSQPEEAPPLQTEVPARPQLEKAAQPRLTLPTLSDRADVWKVATSEFLRLPAIGLGAGNFLFAYDRLRTNEALTVRDPHSLELKVLSEAGIVGAVLLFGAGLLALFGILRVRFRGATRRGGTLHHKDAIAHGWTIALSAGAACWVVQASLDALWVSGGTTVGALLLVAAALAETDALKDPMWPRLPRWSTTRAQVFRVLVGAVAALVLVLTGLPYLSLACQESALSSAQAERAVSQAQTAHWLMPSDPEPLLVLGATYERAAQSLLGSASGDTPAAASALVPGDASGETVVSPSPSEQAGAVLDDLALALFSYQKAVDLEPAYWLPHFRAAVAAANLSAARALEQGGLSLPAYERVRGDFGQLGDWSTLAALATWTVEPAAPGKAPSSLARTDNTRAQAAYYRGLAPADLLQLATFLLEAAKQRNPLEPQIEAASLALEKLRAYTR